MNPPIRIEPEATAELDEATRWHDDKRPGLGTEFLEAIHVALSHIARWPRAGAPVPAVARICRSDGFPPGPSHIMSCTSKRQSPSESSRLLTTGGNPGTGTLAPRSSSVSWELNDLGITRRRDAGLLKYLGLHLWHGKEAMRCGLTACESPQRPTSAPER